MNVCVLDTMVDTEDRKFIKTHLLVLKDLTV